MKIEIFDVEHGACALITTAFGAHILIDCGSSKTWQPGTVLANRGIYRIDQLIITNCDEDHVSGLPNLLEYLSVRSLLRNPLVTPDVLRDLKRQNGIGSGIAALLGMMDRYNEPVVFTRLEALTFCGLDLQIFYNDPSTHWDTNNLSLVVAVNAEGLRFLFPGDLERQGWQSLHHSNMAFRWALASTDVLVASHHGRANGIHNEVFSANGLKPHLVIISDKPHEHETQETIGYYRQLARGARFKKRDGVGVERNVLTTRKDGHLVFNINKSTNAWTVEQQPSYLLELLRLFTPTETR